METEAIKSILEIAKPYSSLLGRFSWKINHYLGENTFPINEINDVIRQLHEIINVYISKFVEGKKINSKDLGDIKKLAEFIAENDKSDRRKNREIEITLVGIISELLADDINIFDVHGAFTTYENAVNQSRINVQKAWSKFLNVTTSCVKEIKLTKNVPESICTEFLNAISKRVDIFSPFELEEFLKLITFPGIENQFGYLNLKSKLEVKPDTHKPNDQRGTSAEEIHQQLKVLLDAMEFEKSLKRQRN